MHATECLQLNHFQNVTDLESLLEVIEVHATRSHRESLSIVSCMSSRVVKERGSKILIENKQMRWKEIEVKPAQNTAGQTKIYPFGCVAREKKKIMIA